MPTCVNFLPPLLCKYQAALLYLLPVAALAVLFRTLARRWPPFLFLYFSGVMLHELAHYAAAVLSNARPVSLSVLPRRQGSAWVLGSVTCRNLCWYNAVFVALAPLAILLVPAAVAVWRTQDGLRWTMDDLWIAPLLAPVLIAFVPSAADLRQALRSWPLLMAAGGAAWLAWGR